MKRRKKELFAATLPNLITASSIFTGVLAAISAFEHDFTKAAWLVLLALVFDGLDGRVARLTKGCSDFGAEFDSLADIVSFGVAPALLLYVYAGSAYGRVGVVVAALYVIFGAVRLARFNVTSSQNEPSVFIGLPIPAAAAFISLAILLFERYGFASGQILLLAGVIALALLMVSNIRYPSFKKISIQKGYIRRIFIALIALLLLLFVYPIEGAFLLLFGYTLFGFLRALYMLFLRLRKRES